MPSSTLPRASFEHRRRLLALWSGIMAGPLVWAVLLQTNYVLSYVACEQGHTWMLHLATGIALVLIAAAAAVAWRAAAPLDALGERADASFDPDRIGLLRFMAVGGLGLCAWFAIVILATELPALVLHPCTP